jgi:hypothetical protein
VRFDLVNNSPSRLMICIRNYSARYKSGLDLVLKEISLSVVSIP